MRDYHDTIFNALEQQESQLEQEWEYIRSNLGEKTYTPNVYEQVLDRYYQEKDHNFAQSVEFPY